MKGLINGIQHYKHRLATLALIFGFFVDIITFRSLDLNYSLMLLSVHLFIVAFTILVLSMPFEDKDGSFFTGVRSWLPVLQHYSMGNLLSAFLILYSASGSLVASWPFLVLVVIAVVGNETLKLEKYRLPFQTSLFFLNLALFSALLTPIVLTSISIPTFLVSLILAIFVFALFRRVLWLLARAAFSEHKWRINRGAFTVLTLIVVLYFSNLMPPIPLTLKTVDFYYSVQRVGDEYVARDKQISFFERFFNVSGKTLELEAGESAYVYTAVFAPARLDTRVVHKWQYFDEKEESWTTKNSVDFPISGGRRAGYRGYSLTQAPTEGRWRISVETARGQIIGRSYMTVTRPISPPTTSTFTIR